MTDVQPRWKTAPRKRGKHAGFARARAKVIERSQGRCEARIGDVCLGAGSQAHHKRRRSQGGQDVPSNLLFVCTACHMHLHANPAWAESVGLLKFSSFSEAPGLISVEKVTR